MMRSGLSMASGSAVTRDATDSLAALGGPRLLPELDAG